MNREGWGHTSGAGKPARGADLKRNADVMYEDSRSVQKTVALEHINEGGRCVNVISVWGGHGVVERLRDPQPELNIA